MWIENALKAIDNPNLKNLNLSAKETLPLLKIEEHHHKDEKNKDTMQAHDHGEYDPHIWLDPLIVKEIVASIKDQLITLDPNNKDTYEKNYAELINQIDILHIEYLTTLKNVAQKEIVVSHNAFNYLTNRYQLKQRPISGISPSDEPTPKEIQTIIDFVKREKIKYLLFEPIAVPKVALAIKEQVDAEVLELTPIENLTPEQIKNGDDYFSLMRKNLESLKKATASTN